MINLPDGKCTGRPGIVQGLTPDGEWRPVASQTEHKLTPYVCQCEHEAISIVEEILLQLAVAVIDGKFSAKDLPHPDKNFRYVFIDELPKGLDAKPDACAEDLAQQAINKAIGAKL